MSFEHHRPLDGKDLETRIGDVFCVYFDGCLWNQRELMRDLGEFPSIPSLLAAAYQLWGDSLPAKLEGEFAFVLHDRRKKTWFAARDSLGVRPLCYRAGKNGLEFAPSLQSFVEKYSGSYSINQRTLLAMMMEVHVNTTASLLKGVHRLSPGHSLVWRDGKVRGSKFFEWKPEPIFADRDERTLTEQYRALIQSAVQKRLSAGGKAGVLLSGGVDSSTLICAAGRIDAGKVESLSLRFEEASATDGGVVDEVNRSGSWAAHSYRPGFEEDHLSLDSWDLWDAPFSPSLAMFAPLLPLAKSRGISQLWWGTGADESLTTSSLVYADLLKDGKLPLLWKEMGYRAERNPAAFLRYALKPLVPQAWNLLWRNHIQAHPLPAWISPRAHSSASDIFEECAQVFRPTAQFYPDWSRRSRYMRLFSSGVCPMAFEQMQAFCRTYELSSTYPLLDLDLLRFAFRLPAEMVLLGKLGKNLLRESMQGIVPDAARLHPKFQDYTAFALQVMRRNQGSLELLFRNSRLLDLGVLNPKRVKRWLSWENPNEDLLVLLQAVDLEKWLLRF